MSEAITLVSKPSRREAAGIWVSYGGWVAIVVMLAVLPLAFSSNASLSLFSLIGVAIIFALSYNILLGQTGLLSFGHAVQYGLGGFLAIHVMNAVARHGWPLPLPFVPLIGGCGGLVFAALVGWVMTKRAGTVFAMISLGIGEMVSSSSLILRSVFGGEGGLTTDRTALPQMFGWTFGSQVQVYYLIAAWTIIAGIAMYALTRTPFGRISNAVRDNAGRVEFVGYDPHVVRYLAYLFAGFFAGIAGSLTAINFEIANSNYLGTVQSGSVLFAAFIGGTTYFVGPVLGAILVTVLQLELAGLTTVWQLYFGIIFISVVMLAPDGIAGLLMRHRPLMRAGALALVIPSYLMAAIPTLALASGVILAIETVARSRSGEGVHIDLIGFSLATASPITWLIAAALTIVGFIFGRGSWRRVGDAWDRAATVARDQGYLV